MYDAICDCCDSLTEPTDSCTNWLTHTNPPEYKHTKSSNQLITNCTGEFIYFIPDNRSLYVSVFFWLYFYLSVRGEQKKKQHNILCDRNCKLCCWDMKIQVLLPVTVTDRPSIDSTDGWIHSFYSFALQITQEKENLMLQQITGQTAQQAPPLPITTQKITQEPTSKPEPQDKLNTSNKKAIEVAKKPRTAKSKRRMSESSDTSSSSMYLFVSSLITMSMLSLNI